MSRRARVGVEHLAVAEPGDLLVYDRSYRAFWSFVLHRHPVIGFCMRLLRSNFLAADVFRDGEEPATVVPLAPSKSPHTRTVDRSLRGFCVRIRHALSTCLAPSRQIF